MITESLEQISSKLKRGVIDPVELAEASIQQITQLDLSLLAWVLVDKEGALKAAKKAYRDIRDGKWLGPLHGIPVGVKDIFDVAGLPTAAGSSLRDGFVAEKDSGLAKSLRNRGAIILGKTVTTEFACFDPAPTRNPWNTSCTPGGSSSGSAVAVASGMCPLATGSQTGGSIIRPAAYCGIAGLKPTYGALPRQGMAPVSFHLDHPGILSRTVNDLTHVWQSLSGNDSMPEEFDRKHPPVLRRLRGFFEAHSSPEVCQAMDETVEKLQSAGAKIDDSTDETDWANLLAHHYRIMAVEAAAYHRASFEVHSSHYGPKISSLIEAGMATTAVDYAAGLTHQRRFRRWSDHWLNDVDAVLLPSAPSAAPAAITTTGDPKFNSPWTYAGAPAVTLPCGLSSTGMPLGLQLIAARRQENRLLQTARWCERVIQFSHAPEISGPFP